MNLKSPKVRLSAALVTVLLLVLFNVSGRALKTTAQTDYESWLAKADQQLRKPKLESSDMPVITIDISSESGQPIHWKFGDSAAPQERDRVLRLLHLIDEAGILTLVPGKSEASPLISIAVRDQKGEFNIKFREADIASNTKVHLMLRLMKEYALAGSDTAVSGKMSVLNDRS